MVQNKQAQDHNNGVSSGLLLLSPGVPAQGGGGAEAQEGGGATLSAPPRGLPRMYTPVSPKEAFRLASGSHIAQLCQENVGSGKASLKGKTLVLPRYG